MRACLCGSHYTPGGDGRARHRVLHGHTPSPVPDPGATAAQRWDALLTRLTQDRDDPQPAVVVDEPRYVHPTTTQCVRGHPWTEDNTAWVNDHVRGRRYRVCAVCRRAGQNRRRAAARAAAREEDQ